MTLHHWEKRRRHIGLPHFPIPHSPARLHIVFFLSEEPITFSRPINIAIQVVELLFLWLIFHCQIKRGHQWPDPPIVLFSQAVSLLKDTGLGISCFPLYHLPPYKNIYYRLNTCSSISHLKEAPPSISQRIS